MVRARQLRSAQRCFCFSSALITRLRAPAFLPARLARVVMPHKLGLYEFKCTVLGHEGMKGVLEVVA